jgi:hypothetical protein
MNERDFPHLVELELPPGGLPSQNLEFDAFHREHGIPIRRGRGRHEARAGDGGGRPGERARTQTKAERLMRSQGSGHGRKPDNQEQNATGRPRQPTMLP